MTHPSWRCSPQLTTDQVATLTGVKVNTIRQYRLRGVFPEPDGYVGRTPWWNAETVEAWQATRRPGGRPKGSRPEET